MIRFTSRKFADSEHYRDTSSLETDKYDLKQILKGLFTEIHVIVQKNSFT